MFWEIDSLVKYETTVRLYKFEGIEKCTDALLVLSFPIMLTKCLIFYEIN